MAESSNTVEKTNRRRQRGAAVKVRVFDRRTKEAATYREAVDGLTKHLGGRVSATQRCLIERAAMLTVHLARLDKRSLEVGAMSEADTRCYLAWSNTLVRTMRQLGLAAAPATHPSPLDMIAALRGRQQAGSAA